MVRVASEAILEIDYDPAAAMLFIRFIDGDWYRYFDVPSQIHDAFLAADSHGSFFQSEIRDRYRYRKGRREAGGA